MSVGDEDISRSEIVIVRRRSGDGEDGHHGGVWKIAYADFMTAMMAFFLVMWLVNASNKDTRAQVASYFNPLKLTDSMASPKGLKELQPGARSQKQIETPAGPSGSAQADDSAKTLRTRAIAQSDAAAKVATEELFSDPYGVLARLAARSRAGSRDAGWRSKQNGSAFRDPFEPGFRNEEAISSSAPADAGKTNATPPARAQHVPQSVTRDSRSETDPQRERPALPSPTGQAARGSSQEKALQSGISQKANSRRGKARVASKSPPDPARPGKAEADGSPHAMVRDDLKARLDALIRMKNAADLPRVELKRVPEGVLVSLTDKDGFSMFNLGSAVPNPDVVVFFKALAETLASQPGPVVIAGHTDARPYRKGGYDNWRLSTDRAHVAAHMLVLGGLATARIERVEGHAARKLRNMDDPLAPENRRVDILLRTQGTP